MFLLKWWFRFLVDGCKKKSRSSPEPVNFTQSQTSVFPFTPTLKYKYGVRVCMSNFLYKEKENAIAKQKPGLCVLHAASSTCKLCSNAPLACRRLMRSKVKRRKVSFHLKTNRWGLNLILTSPAHLTLLPQQAFRIWCWSRKTLWLPVFFLIYHYFSPLPVLKDNSSWARTARGTLWGI